MTPVAVILAGASVLGIWSAFTGENPLTILQSILLNRELPRVGRESTIRTDVDDDQAANVASGAKSFSHPTGGRGRVSSGFRTPQRPNHNGIDYAVPEGTPIYSAHTGVVTRADYSSSYGNVIYLEQGDIQTRYAHLRAGGIAVRLGQRVNGGVLIGYSGNTGRSTGPHLHFEIRVNGEAIDPAGKV